MMNTQQLLQLRKLTRAISDLLRGQLKEYLTTLAPLLRARAVFGEYLHSSTKEAVRGADKAFKDLQSLYQSVAGAKPFNLPKELTPPIELMSATLEIVPMEYVYRASTEQSTKEVVVTSPLKWILFHSGYSLSQLRAILADRNRSDAQVREFLLHHLVLHSVMSRQNGVTKILETLHFPVRTEQNPDLGGLPITVLSSTLSTLRPADEVIIESTEISGTDAFEELVRIEDISRMSNPLQEQLLELVKTATPGLLPSP
ncbi:MAG: hypothetical protein AB1898_28035 [Acidobacteriota bacterium]